MSAGLAGYQVREIPAEITDREFGTSSASTIQALTLTLKTLVVVTLGLYVPIAKKMTC